MHGPQGIQEELGSQKNRSAWVLSPWSTLMGLCLSPRTYYLLSYLLDNCFRTSVSFCGPVFFLFFMILLTLLSSKNLSCLQVASYI